MDQGKVTITFNPSGIRTLADELASQDRKAQQIRPITIESSIHFRRRGRGSRKEIPEAATASARPRTPHFAVHALAIRFERLIQAGQIADYAELARLGHVTRARITQIMNLGCLAPDLQEQLLFLPRIEGGRDAIHLRQLSPSPPCRTGGNKGD